MIVGQCDLILVGLFYFNFYAFLILELVPVGSEFLRGKIHVSEQFF